MFTVHTTGVDGRRLQLVPHSFSRSAFLFAPLWLLAKRLWTAAVSVVIFQIAVVWMVACGALDPLAGTAMLGVCGLLVGLEGREWVRRSLARRGGPVLGFAYGASYKDALAALVSPAGSQS